MLVLQLSSTAVASLLLSRRCARLLSRAVLTRAGLPAGDSLVFLLLFLVCSVVTRRQLCCCRLRRLSTILAFRFNARSVVLSSLYGAIFGTLLVYVLALGSVYPMPFLVSRGGVLFIRMSLAHFRSRDCWLLNRSSLSFSLQTVLAGLSGFCVSSAFSIYFLPRAQRNDPIFRYKLLVAIGMLAFGEVVVTGFVAYKLLFERLRGASQTAFTLVLPILKWTTKTVNHAWDLCFARD
jgi:hypothetical protein